MSDGNPYVCARCGQPIRWRELYHHAVRAALLGAPPETYVVPGETVIVHVFPCPVVEDEP